MKFLLALHITAGSLAIIAGFIAIFALKRGRLHRQCGTIFVYSMLGLGITGALIAAIRSQPANVVGGSLAVYMVGTGVLTLRRREQNFFWVDAAGTALALGIGYFSLTIQADCGRMPPCVAFGGSGFLAINSAHTPNVSDQSVRGPGPEHPSRSLPDRSPSTKAERLAARNSFLWRLPLRHPHGAQRVEADDLSSCSRPRDRGHSDRRRRQGEEIQAR